MKIGTIGTGAIVDTFLSAVNDIPELECMVMYSRRKESAQHLARKYKINKIYTDLYEMLEKSNVDFIYIASPNSLHCEQAILCMKHGKNIICEKPIASNLKEMNKLIKIAKEKSLMFFEAITTIHLPNYKLIKENLNKIGRVRIVQCNFSQYSSRYDKLLARETTNVFDPEFSGGVLQDLNIYNLHFIMNLFGVPKKVNYFTNKHTNGIDTSGILFLKYPDFICECVAAKDSDSKNLIQIQGEKGYILVEDAPNSCKEFSLYKNSEKQTFNLQKNTNSLYYELLEFRDIYQKNDFDKCFDLLCYSSYVIKVLTKARKDGKIIFGADKRKN